MSAQSDTECPTTVHALVAPLCQSLFYPVIQLSYSSLFICLHARCSRLMDISDRITDTKMKSFKLAVMDSLMVFHAKKIELNKTSYEASGLLPWYCNRDVRSSSENVLMHSSKSALGAILFDENKNGNENKEKTPEELDIESALANGLVLGTGITGCCVGNISLPRDAMWAISITILLREPCVEEEIEGEEEGEEEDVKKEGVNDRRERKEQMKFRRKKRRKDRKSGEEEGKNDDEDEIGKEIGKGLAVIIASSQENSQNIPGSISRPLRGVASIRMGESGQKKRVFQECYDNDHIAVRLGSNLDNLSLLGSYYLTPNPDSGTVLHDIQYVFKGNNLAFRFDFSTDNTTSAKRLVVETGYSSFISHDAIATALHV